MRRGSRNPSDDPEQEDHHEQRNRFDQAKHHYIVAESLARLGERIRMGAIEGDIATERDAERLRRLGIPAHQILTHGACHLDARMVIDALHRVSFGALDLLFIENVGNLVCPAVYDLGQVANVVALSVTEGEDKPLKYPVMFRSADLVLLTKIDLLPHLEVRTDAIAEALAHVMPEVRLIPVSARTGEGLDAWLAWLEEMDLAKVPALRRN